MVPHTFHPIFSSWHCIWAKAGDSVSFTLELKLKLTQQGERVYVRMLRENSCYILKKIIRRQQFFEEIAAGDCNTFVSVTPWETAVMGVSFSDTYGSEGARSVSRQVSSFWRLDGKVTRSRLWRKPEPKLKLWRLDGKVTRSRLWLTPQPQLKLWRLDGKVTCSRLWLKFSPKLRLLTS